MFALVRLHHSDIQLASTPLASTSSVLSLNKKTRYPIHMSLVYVYSTNAVYFIVR